MTIIQPFAMQRRTVSLYNSIIYLDNQSDSHSDSNVRNLKYENDNALIFPPPLYWVVLILMILFQGQTQLNYKPASFLTQSLDDKAVLYQHTKSCRVRKTDYVLSIIITPTTFTPPSFTEAIDFKSQQLGCALIIPHHYLYARPTATP